jgi:hypothetical protein
MAPIISTFNAEPAFLEHRGIVSNVPLRHTPEAMTPQAKSIHLQDVEKSASFFLATF